MSLNDSDFISPFSTTTVVVADNYIDAFPNSQELIALLQNLFVKFSVDVLSSDNDRPLIIKSSWITIKKVDLFLSSLISILHTAISQGSLPNKTDLNAAFSHFYFEKDYHHYDHDFWNAQMKTFLTNSLHHNDKCLSFHSLQKKDKKYLEPSPLNLNLESDHSNTSEITNSVAESKPFDKNRWHFSSNLRGKTGNKIHKQCSWSGNPLPEPFVVIEAEVAKRNNLPSLMDVEETLCEVYKKETIEKYKQVKNYASTNEEKAVLLLQEKNVEKKISMNDEILALGSKTLSNFYCDDKNSLKLTATESSNNAKNVNDFSQEDEKQFMKKEAQENNSHHSYNLRDSEQNRSQMSLIERKLLSCREILKQLNSPTKKEKLDKNKNDTNFLNEQKSTTNAEKKKTYSKPKTVKQNKVKNYVNKKHKAEVCSSTLQKTNKITLNYKQYSKTLEIVSKNSTQSNENLIEDNHSLISVYKCSQCPFETSKQLRLTSHTRRVHLTVKFSCEICSKEFGLKKDLQRHEKCHKKAQNCCDICGKLYKAKRTLLEHKKTHSEDYVKPEFNCKFCSGSFSTKYVLAAHIKSNHLGMKRSYICPTCGKVFSQKSSYVQHANAHLGIRPYVCEHCGKKFSYEKSLRDHMFMHKAEKSFSCTVCSKLFRQSTGLAIHMKVHNVTKDNICSVCGKNFSQRQSLLRHERIHAGDKPFECKLCQRTFADSSVLRRHIILVHKKDPKNWQEFTACHLQKKREMFMSPTDNICCTENISACKNETVSELSSELQLQNSKQCVQLFVPDTQTSDLQKDSTLFLSTANLIDKNVKDEPIYSTKQEPTVKSNERFGDTDSGIAEYHNLHLHPPDELPVDHDHSESSNLPSSQENLKTFVEQDNILVTSQTMICLPQPLSHNVSNDPFGPLGQCTQEHFSFETIVLQDNLGSPSSNSSQET